MCVSLCLQEKVGEGTRAIANLLGTIDAEVHIILCDPMYICYL